jgi:antitoxin VapB
MGLYIRNEETCRMARELAALMGVTITEAIKVAVRERLERLQATHDSELPARGAVASVKPKTTSPA